MNTSDTSKDTSDTKDINTTDTKDINTTDWITCADCGGTGAISSAGKHPAGGRVVLRCTICHGTGQVSPGAAPPPKRRRRRSAPSPQLSLPCDLRLRLPARPAAAEEVPELIEKVIETEQAPDAAVSP